MGERVKVSLIVVWLVSTVVLCGLAGFVGAATRSEWEKRAFFDAGWEGGKKWQAKQPCNTANAATAVEKEGD